MRQVMKGLGFCLLLLAACDAQSKSEQAPVAAPQAETKTETQPQTQRTGGNPMVVIKTSKGEMQVELYADKAPKTVENFLAYVDAGFFDGTIFHRVIPGFMIQGGGFDASMNQKETRAQIKNEAQNGLKNDRGTLAMARTNVVDSATAQFFVNLVNNDFLDHAGPANYGYAVFGKVTAGMDVVDRIATEVPLRGEEPQQTVYVESVALAD